jgi:hypothetical protein
LANYPQVAGLCELNARLTRGASWVRLTDLQGGAGLHVVSASRWSPETPQLLTRLALLGGLTPTEISLVGHRDLVFDFDRSRAAELELTLALAVVPHLPVFPLTIVCEGPDAPPRRVRLCGAGPYQALRLSIPAGRSQVRLRIEQPLANHYVRVRATERIEAVRPDTRCSLAVVPYESDRVYHVATHDAPLYYVAEAPAWLRIDELRDDRTVTRFVAATHGAKRLELRPEAGRDAALLRLFKLIVQPDRPTSPPPWIRVPPQPVPPPWLDLCRRPARPPAWSAGCDGVSAAGADWEQRLNLLSLAPPDARPPLLEIGDRVLLGEQDEGTWSLEAGFVRRRPLEEDLVGRAPDQFQQSIVTYRYHDGWENTYWKTDLLFRVRHESGPTLGLVQSMAFEDDLLPLSLRLDAGGYLQRPADATEPATAHTEWSMFFRGRLAAWQYFSPLCFHVPNVTVFGRPLSLDGIRYLPGRVDQDIFTVYKANHHAGLILSDTLVVEPWLDTRWWLRPSLYTNEDFNFVSPDHMAMQVGWRQAWGPVEADVSYRLAQFFRDNDRSRDKTQHLLYADVIADVWLGRHRTDWALGLRHDVGRSATSVFLSLVWFFDHGRGYRDMMRGELWFPDLRRQRLARRSPPPTLLD